MVDRQLVQRGRWHGRRQWPQSFKTFGDLQYRRQCEFLSSNGYVDRPANFRIIGEDIARVDIPLKTNYGVIKHCPTLEAL